MRRIITSIIFNASYLLLLLFSVGMGFPTERAESSTVLKLTPNETNYPNGTVVGKYSYTDKEGNPVQVKYYADDSSYGVELNSVKMFGTKEGKNKAAIEKPKEKHDQPDQLQHAEYSDGYKYPAEETKENRYDTTSSDETESINKLDTAHFKNQYSPDYDIYKTKDDASNVKCGVKNDKAYIYNFEAGPKMVHVQDIAEEESPFCQLLY